MVIKVAGGDDSVRRCDILYTLEIGSRIEILSTEWLFDHHTTHVQPLMTFPVLLIEIMFIAVETIETVPSTAIQMQNMIYWLGEKVLHSICEAAREIGK